MSRRRTPVKFVTDPNTVSGYGGAISNKEAGYELVVEGDDDIIIIHGEEGVGFRVNRTQLMRTLEQLQPYSQSLTSALTPSELDLFRTVVDATRVLYAYPAAYALITQDIHSVFPPSQDAKPGTVGAFFVGCSIQSTNSQVPGGCQSSCAASMPGLDTDACQDLVLVYQNGTLKSLNDQSTPHAYIYVTGTDKLSAADITQLRSAGVSSITLITTDNEGSYREVTSYPNLDDVIGGASDTGGEITETSAGTSWIIFFVVIILLGILIYLIAANWKRFG